MLCEKLENPDFLMGENSMSEGSMNSGRMSIPECYQARRKTKPFGGRKNVFRVSLADVFFEVRKKLRSCGNTRDQYSECETERRRNKPLKA